MGALENPELLPAKAPRVSFQFNHESLILDLHTPFTCALGLRFFSTETAHPTMSPSQSGDLYGSTTSFNINKMD
jgi:hypothetical protein